MRADLESELAAAAVQLPFAALEMLWGMGADRRFAARLSGLGDLGLARVELAADGASWMPEGPDRRLMIAVRDRDGDLIDIVAVASHRRDQWALRTGDGWALGMDQLDETLQARDEAQAHAAGGKPARVVRLRIWASPFDWLAAGGRGLCVLDWGLPALTALRALGERVVLEVDAGAQERLRALLAHGGLPRVEAAPVVRGMAA